MADKPLRVFLHEVHAGFISGMGAGYGPTRPAYMETLADLSGLPDDDLDEEDELIASTRLLVIATDGGHLQYCLSSDLAPGQVALAYEGDIDPQDLALRLDALMLSRLE
ncbi:hypothetical protein GCM10022224_009820 [Nonomuraea antimicrobica]|uniref:SMI1/KNR4 family protein n=1 Tax=Nonomuraea antimicrobica TaxID=561173 RepID=A0ABP7B4G7_9ACTN